MREGIRRDLNSKEFKQSMGLKSRKRWVQNSGTLFFEFKVLERNQKELGQWQSHRGNGGLDPPLFQKMGPEIHTKTQ